MSEKWDIFAEWCHFSKDSRDPDKIWYEYIETKEGTERSISAYCNQLDKKSGFARDGTWNWKETLVSYECALAEENYLQYLKDTGFEVMGVNSVLSVKIQELKKLGFTKEQIVDAWEY